MKRNGTFPEWLKRSLLLNPEAWLGTRHMWSFYVDVDLCNSCVTLAWSSPGDDMDNNETVTTVPPLFDLVKDNNADAVNKIAVMYNCGRISRLKVSFVFEMITIQQILCRSLDVEIDVATNMNWILQMLKWKNQAKV